MTLNQFAIRLVSIALIFTGLMAGLHVFNELWRLVAADWRDGAYVSSALLFCTAWGAASVCCFVGYHASVVFVDWAQRR